MHLEPLNPIDHIREVHHVPFADSFHRAHFTFDFRGALSASLQHSEDTPISALIIRLQSNQESKSDTELFHKLMNCLSIYHNNVDLLELLLSALDFENEGNALLILKSIPLVLVNSNQCSTIAIEYFRSNEESIQPKFYKEIVSIFLSASQFISEELSQWMLQTILVIEEKSRQFDLDTRILVFGIFPILARYPNLFDHEIIDLIIRFSNLIYTPDKLLTSINIPSIKTLQILLNKMTNDQLTRLIPKLLMNLENGEKFQDRPLLVASSCLLRDIFYNNQGIFQRMKRNVKLRFWSLKLSFDNQNDCTTRVVKENLRDFFNFLSELIDETERLNLRNPLSF